MSRQDKNSQQDTKAFSALVGRKVSQYVIRSLEKINPSPLPLDVGALRFSRPFSLVEG